MFTEFGLVYFHDFPGRVYLPYEYFTLALLTE
jgi:hypothetical protein